MSQALQQVPPDSTALIIERVLIAGDLGKLSAMERVQYYRSVCASVGLNPLTKPFEYINLNGKLTLYATKNCTDQLRARESVSVTIVGREIVDDMYIVTARATTPGNRSDEDVGAVSLPKAGENRANAMMKAHTKAKRRVTLSICGLSFVDESELETIPTARQVDVDHETGEVRTTALPPSKDVAYQVSELLVAYTNCESGDDYESLEVRRRTLWGKSVTKDSKAQLKAAAEQAAARVMTNLGDEPPADYRTPGEEG